MATRRTVGKEPDGTPPRRRRPATTPEAREHQMIGIAFDLAERQLLDGTASAQVITHYLKLGSSRERLEQERLSREVELMGAKVEAMSRYKAIEELYGQALSAMKSYSGQEDPDDGDPYEN